MAALPSIPNHWKFLFLERKTWTRPMLCVSSLSGSLEHGYRHCVYITLNKETGTCTKGTRQSSRPNCRRQRHRQQLPFQNPLPSDQKIDFWQNIAPNRFYTIFIKSGHLQMAFVQEGFVVNLQEFYIR